MSETMRRGLAAALIGAAVLAGLLVGWTGGTAAPVAVLYSLPGALRTTPETEARIARIENGLLPPVTIAGQAAPAVSIAEQMQRDKVPAVSVAFFENGSIVWARGYGYADIEKKTPVTPETLFQAASISKPVAALAAMHLVEQGALSLDEDVNAKLQSWKVPDNEFTKTEKVTLRRLLTHCAGLTVHGFLKAWQRRDSNRRRAKSFAECPASPQGAQAILREIFHGQPVKGVSRPSR